MYAWRVSGKKHLLSLSWSNESTCVYANYLAKSSRDQYNRYLTQFKEFCIDSYDSPFPPARDRLNPMIADFLCMPHFAIKIAKFCKLSFLFKVFFGPGGPEY